MLMASMTPIATMMRLHMVSVPATIKKIKTISGIVEIIVPATAKSDLGKTITIITAIIGVIGIIWVAVVAARITAIYIAITVITVTPDVTACA